MIKAFFVKLGIVNLLRHHYVFVFYALIVILAFLILYYLIKKFGVLSINKNSSDSALESTVQSDRNQIPTRTIEGVANDEDLASNTWYFIENYQNSRDFEQLYDRLWHCLRWQQFNQEDRVLDIARDLAVST
jgi:hypothetical protein